MSKLKANVVSRNFDYPVNMAKKTTGATKVGTIDRDIDRITLSTTISWVDQNDWRTAFTPSDGESGDLLCLFTDNDSKTKFQVFSFSRSGATTTITEQVDLGDATVKIEAQNSSGTIQIRHNSGGNRTCNVKIGGTQHYVPV